MATAGAQVTAIDLAPDLLKIARLHGLESGVKIDYRPVHEFTLTDDIQYIKPKKRVY